MGLEQEVLIHKAENFSYDTLQRRIEQHGFNSIAKLELFLWDLEMFLQIQQILGSKVVLKGGAAVQFYLPIGYQRSSIDIDLIGVCSRAEIEACIEQIEDRFNTDGEFFKFRLHEPKNPKTSLSLLTYYLKIPSVCKPLELTTGPQYAQVPAQEIKIEFLLSDQPLILYKFSAPRLFAVETDRTYQILPLDSLLADKLSTLGPNTIGVPIRRADEQIKQLYDIDSILTWNIDSVNFAAVRKNYAIRAQLETRARGLKYDMAQIVEDVEKQLEDLSFIDFPTNQQYKKRIDDFQSLYLRRTINRNVSGWAIVGKKLLILYQLLKNEDDKTIESIRHLYHLERKLDFSEITGPQKGLVIKRFKADLLKDFESHCRMPVNQIQGKNLKRIFWEIISVETIAPVIDWTNEYFKSLDNSNAR